MMQDAPAIANIPPTPRDRAGWLVPIALALILLLGGYFRFVGLNWDDYTYLHPDERFLNDVASSLGGGHWLIYSDPAALTAEQQAQRTRCLERYPTTQGVGGYFDAECSTWNPHNASQRFQTFVYGTLPLFATRATAETLTQITGDTSHTSFYGIHLVWRTLSALSEMGVIVVVFLCGLRAHNKWIGLLAAALYAFTVFSIQQAHFGTTDPVSNLFAALCILFAISVQRTGRLVDYALFGAAFGCALASRINLLPLIGLLVVAMSIRLLPILRRGLDGHERDRLWTHSAVGLVLAAVMAGLLFRLFNPYAFMGPGVLGLQPNAQWLNDLGEVRFFVSGEWDAPPNWQWIARPVYLFPLWNMILWGMGVALGLAGWLSFVWALWRILRGRPGALANVILVAWVAAYYLFMGRQWVMTMRYFLPLYPALAVLAAWGLAALVQKRAAGSRQDWELSAEYQVPSAEYPEPRTQNALIRALGWLTLILVVGFSLLWALMFTDVYRNLSNRVAASYWFWEQVPSDFAMRIDGAPDGTPLINIVLPNRSMPGDTVDWVGQATRFVDSGERFLQEFTVPASGRLTHIHAPHLGDTTDTGGDEVLRFALYRADDNVQVASATLTADLTRAEHPLGVAYDIPLDQPLAVTEGDSYRFEVVLEQGANVVSGGSLVVWEGSWDDPLPVNTCTPSDGLSLADNPPPGRYNTLNCNGRSGYAGLLGGGYKLEMVNNDSPANRDRMLELLDVTDYIIISSNRFYDTMTRNPARWPMTTRYYETLFSGELGFDVGAVFNRAFGLGPLRVPDNHLPFFDAPAWLNEYEAEEAFHVYDHPAVIIMAKDAARYTAANAEAILYSQPIAQSTAANPLNNCALGLDSPACRCPDAPDSYYCDPTLIDQDAITSLQASRTPTYLMLTPEARATQDAGGTWAQRFDSASLINSQPVVTVVLWWLAITVFGWAAWPLLFSLFPALDDRGYGVAKIAGLLLVAWGVWYLASILRAPLWSGGGVLAGLILLLLLSLVVAWGKRAELAGYVRQRWATLAVIEAITLVCFLGFLAVRLSNPDIWHFAFGGEKPMDFAYFNAVLRSSTFPAYDPWFAGGFINYYYFGFVIAGAPTLLLGVVPSLAYNLIIPTFFAITGISAFSVAFNLVAGLRFARSSQFGNESGQRTAGSGQQSAGSEENSAPSTQNPELRTQNSEPASRDVNPEPSAQYASSYPWLALSALFFTPPALVVALLIWQINLGAATWLRVPLGLFAAGVVLFMGMLLLRRARHAWPMPASTGAMQRSANPWLAGLVALMLAVVLGNLDTPRTFTGGLFEMARLGGVNTAQTLDDFLINEALQRAEENGEQIDYMLLEQQVQNPNLLDRVRYDLSGSGVMLRAFGDLVRGSNISLAPHRWYWGPTRILGETPGVEGNAIAEMPWFTFLYGDLHAHMLAMPLHLLALAFLLNEILSALGGKRSRAQAILALALGAITVGMLFATNSWDWITYIILGVVGLGYAWWLRYQRISRDSVMAFAGTVGGFFVLSQLASLPYTTWFASAYTSVLPWTQGRTPLWIYFSIYGVFLLLAISLLVWDTARWLRAVKVRALARTFPLVIAALLLLGMLILGAVLAAAAGYPVAVVVVPLLAWIFILFFRSGQSRAMQFWLAIVGLALSLTLGVEIIVLSGDIGRQNTVFKFYMQAWLLLSVAGGAAFAWLWESAMRWSVGLRSAFSWVAALLFIVAGLYPVMSTYGRAQDRFTPLPPTLDGLAYMQYATHGENGQYFPLETDYRIIRWLQANVEGLPVIMEAQSEPNLYKWGSRIAINTGLPAVVGWDWHQTQQRGLYNMPAFIRQRGSNVNAFYSTRDIETATRIMDFYAVEYIIVGALERVYYSAESLAKFDQMVTMGLLEAVYSDGDARIYRVVSG